MEELLARRRVKLITSCLALLLTVYVTSSSRDPDVQGEALLELLKALNDTNNKISDWNQNFVSPCFSWSYVTCRKDDVISLSLGSHGFTGTLAHSITKLKFLEHLDLQHNQLHGPLPDYLGDLIHLQILNLGHNNFSGSIPASWNGLLHLKHLDLSSNALSGTIPLVLISTPVFNFTGNDGLVCGHGLRPPCISSTYPPVSTAESKLKIVTATGCGLLLLLALWAVILYRIQRLRKLSEDVFVDVSGEDDRKNSLGQLRRFSWRELQLATDNFNENNIIGHGGFGKVYKGILPDNTKVAVKRLKDYYNPGGEAAFQREVQLISVAVHRNLLRLIGFCTTSSERILIYPFMKNLSVANHLRDLKPGQNGLDWSNRKRVAFGVARGLEYLHEHCNPKIIHRDLKAANILLDDDFEAVLGDFGLAKLVDPRLTHVTTQVRGTMGHIAPEYLSTGKSSEKTDVFGYGVTILELVTGQRAIDLSRLEEEEDVLLLDHIIKLKRENRLTDIVDHKLKIYDAKEVETFIKVALLCTQGSPEDRPKMEQVVNMLKGIGLEDRWTAWESLDEVQKQEFTLVLDRFSWADESTQEALHLSKAR
ncbi:unnamed protein product [Rhodiola kirilowii]